MDKEREQSMFFAASILSGPIDKIDRQDLDDMLSHGNVPGAFVCGVRWADRNPDSPWVNIDERLPEDSLHAISGHTAKRQSVKVMVLMKNGNVMQADRRISLHGIWYWNIPQRMRDEVTHWMPIPPVPNVEPENQE